MNKKLILAAPCVVMLAACGGGSTGSSDFQTITSFPDGRTYAKITTVDASAVALIKNPDFDINNLQSVEIISGADQIERNDGSYAGTYVVKLADGTQASARGQGYGSLTSNARMFVIEDTLTGEINASVVDGTNVINMPTGLLNYTGQSYLEYGWRTDNDANWNREDGVMDMTVNLDNGSASINVVASGSSYRTNGLSVNANTGEISGTNGTFTVLYTNGDIQSTRAVDFNGNLSGDNAEYVYGAGYKYVDNNDYSLVGVVGKR